MSGEGPAGMWWRRAADMSGEGTAIRWRGAATTIDEGTVTTRGEEP